MTSEALDAASAYASNFQREVGDVSRNSFLAGARWQAEQDRLDESEIAKVAAQRAERIHELEEGREMEQHMLRNAAERILELEQALEDSGARFRLLDANRSDAAAAVVTRAEAAEAKLAKVRAECQPLADSVGANLFEDGRRQHAYRILAILEGDTDDA